MALLVDTHAFLWFVFDDPRLSARADELLSDPSVAKALSIASLWEIAVKVSVSKLSLGMRFDSFLSTCVTNRDVSLLPITVAHLCAYAELPLHHRDPFDRLLVAQCLAENCPILSRDPRFAQYSVEVVW